MARAVKGFTLVEMVIVLAILAIALAIAIPDFSKYETDYQISSQINQIYSDLQFAKFYAITHKVQTVFAFNGTNYNIYYTDSNNNNTSLKNITIKYPISLSNSTSSNVVFDIHGFVDEAQSIPIAIYVTQQNHANPNCINIEYTEIDLGLWSNNACVSQ